MALSDGINKLRKGLAGVINPEEEEETLRNFKELADSRGSGMESLNRFMSSPDNRRELYKQLEQMAKDSINSNVLHTFADDIMGIHNEHGSDIKIEIDDDESKQEEANKKMREWGALKKAHDVAFYMMQFGDEFVRVFDEEDNGVVRLDFQLHPKLFKRVEKKGRLAGWPLNSDSKDTPDVLEPWKVLHFRSGITARNKRKKFDTGFREGGYGSSVLERVMMDWKKLNLMENSMVITRYNKARRPTVYYIDVTGIPKDEQEDYFEDMRELVMSEQGKSKEDSSFESQRELFSQSEPIAVPIENNQGKIEVADFSENPNVKSIVDVEYLRDKYHGGIQVPSAFLGLEDKLPSGIGESSLISMSTRYARTVRKAKAQLLLPFRRLVRIHFAHKGEFLEPDDVRVKTQSVTTAEDLTRAETANKVVSTIQSIAQLFDRTLDVDINQEVFAEFVIDSLNMPQLDTQKLLNQEEMENQSGRVLERVNNYLNPPPTDPVQVNSPMPGKEFDFDSAREGIKEASLVA